MAVLKPLEKDWLEGGSERGQQRITYARAHRDRASVSRARVVNTVRSKADEHFTVFCAITGMECGLEPRTTSASHLPPVVASRRGEKSCTYIACTCNNDTTPFRN